MRNINFITYIRVSDSTRATVIHLIVTYCMTPYEMKLLYYESL